MTYNSYRNKKGKNTHFIDTYNAHTDYIVCCCKWEGGGDIFLEHQLNAPPTDAVRPEPYGEMKVEYHFPLGLRKKISDDPGYLDYKHKSGLWDFDWLHEI